VEKRTIRDFTVAQDVWPIVMAWAQEENYQLLVRQSTETRRVYQRGTGMMTAAMKLLVEQSGNQVHLEAWIPIGFFTRLTTLFLMPAEMGITSGGFRGVVPRNMARKAANKLLERLGQPQIP